MSAGGMCVGGVCRLVVPQLEGCVCRWGVSGGGDGMKPRMQSMEERIANKKMHKRTQMDEKLIKKLDPENKASTYRSQFQHHTTHKASLRTHVALLCSDRCCTWC